MAERGDALYVAQVLHVPSDCVTSAICREVATCQWELYEHADAFDALVNAGKEHALLSGHEVEVRISQRRHAKVRRLPKGDPG